jgi:hypothetical protein
MAEPLLPKKLSSVDIFVTVVFFSIAALGISLFMNDLLRTINLWNVEPVGIVVVKKNIVQRRLSDRVLWDRLTEESPVYFGDLIRVAEDSAATLYFDGSSIDLNENTLIRITRTADRGLQILLNEGNLSLVAQEDSSRITVNINGRQIQPVSGMDINFEMGRSGFEFLDGDIVRQPVSNARYLNDSEGPFTVSFLWNRGALADSEVLRLELASDRNFRRIVHVRENLNRQIQVPVANGLWYWRLLNRNTVFDEGRFSVTDGAGVVLQSPAASSVFKYTDEAPVMNFQWEHIDEAIQYVLEVSDSEKFETPQIRRESEVTFFTSSNLEDGTWYWRVKPVFPSIYSGSSSFSQAASFRIEQAAAEPEQALSFAEWFVTEVPPELLPEIVTPAARAQGQTQGAAVLAAPQNLQPARNRAFTMADLQTQRNIRFSWNPVQGADAYIFTLHHESDSGRRQILRTQPLNYPNYTLDDLRILDRGTFIWQVEAVTTGAGGSINRRGNVSESIFVMDIVLPGSVQVR